MRFGLLLLFIAVPLIELALLIRVGQSIGTLATIGLVITTAVIGTWVLQRQGIRTMYRLQAQMARGEPPVEPIIEGVFILVAGGFLLTPGILTDITGFLLLIPPVRRWIMRWGFAKLLRSGKVRVSRYGQPSGDPRADGPGRPDRSGGPGRNDGPEPSSSGPGPVIDGEYERVEDNKPHKQR